MPISIGSVFAFSSMPALTLSLCDSESLANLPYSYGLGNRIDIINFDEIGNFIENIKNTDRNQV